MLQKFHEYGAQINLSIVVAFSIFKAMLARMFEQKPFLYLNLLGTENFFAVL